jgi:hypothetical protein
MNDPRWAITEGIFCRNSDAYRWLRSRHAEIISFLETGCGTFSYVVTQINDDGIKGTKGQALDYNSLKDIWRRVKRDVARDAAAKPGRTLRVRA